MAGHQVVGRGVHTEKRQVEKAGGVGGAGVVDGQDAVGHLLYPFAENPLRHRDRHPHGVENVGLHPHHVVKPGQRPPLGVVSEHEIEGLLFTETVGENQLAHLHVHPDEHAPDFGVGGAVDDPRVVVGVGQLLGIEKFPLFLRQPFERLLDVGKDLLQPLRSAGVGFPAGFNRQAIDLSEFHGVPASLSLTRRLTSEPSARPASRGTIHFITRPRSRTVSAPVSRSPSSTSAASWSAERAAGR